MTIDAEFINIGIDVIQKLGVPIAVMVWLFFERRTTMEQMIQAIQANTDCTNALINLLENKK